MLLNNDVPLIVISMTINKTWFSEAENALVEITGSILQTNKSATSKIMDAVVAKGAGAASVVSVTSLITILGTASTGTAIGALTGAAATTAKLFWIGSLVGGGVAAGGGILAVGAVATGFGVMRYWKGSSRSVETLEPHEVEILSAVELLLPALKTEASKERNLTNEETGAVTAIWRDLADSVDIYNREDAARLLAPKQRLRLKLAHRKLRKLLKRI